MIKTILVPATGTSADHAVFAAALGVARHFSAHLDVLHVRVDPAEAASALFSDVGGAMASADIIDRLEAECAELEDKARKSFQGFCTREKLIVGDAPSTAQSPSASWHRETGREPYWLAEFAKTCDLLVVGRPIENRGVMPETLEAALFDSGRPLLIPGPAPRKLTTIAIAWKPTRESARAVAAAMPIIEKADRIVILTASEKDAVDRDSAARLLRNLERHGLTVEVRQLEAGARGAAETLLAAASAIDAGLLVMGGYGHSRVREFVFGGVTEHVIRSAPLPVLMAH